MRVSGDISPLPPLPSATYRSEVSTSPLGPSVWNESAWWSPCSPRLKAPPPEGLRPGSCTPDPTLDSPSGEVEGGPLAARLGGMGGHELELVAANGGCRGWEPEEGLGRGEEVGGCCSAQW